MKILWAFLLGQSTITADFFCWSQGKKNHTTAPTTFSHHKPKSSNDILLTPPHSEVVTLNLSSPFQTFLIPNPKPVLSHSPLGVTRSHAELLTLHRPSVTPFIMRGSNGTNAAATRNQRRCCARARAARMHTRCWQGVRKEAG